VVTLGHRSTAGRAQPYPARQRTLRDGRRQKRTRQTGRRRGPTATRAGDAGGCRSRGRTGTDGRLGTYPQGDRRYERIDHIRLVRRERNRPDVDGPAGAHRSSTGLSGFIRQIGQHAAVSFSGMMNCVLQVLQTSVVPLSSVSGGRLDQKAIVSRVSGLQLELRFVCQFLPRLVQLHSTWIRRATDRPWPAGPRTASRPSSYGVVDELSGPCLGRGWIVDSGGIFIA